MRTMNVKSKQTSVLLGVFAMVAVVTLAPHAFAQEASQLQQNVQQGGNQIAQQSAQGQQGGIPLGTPTGTQYTLGSGGIQEPSTAGSDPTPAYATGIAV
ncbi:MAG: hypothetical protein KGI25_03620, partial [Thaumarchaeota archaeon]|nr:hypothetical protein [Nitrososphaerota archaeon]